MDAIKMLINTFQLFTQLFSALDMPNLKTDFLQQCVTFVHMLSETTNDSQKSWWNQSGKNP